MHKAISFLIILMFFIPTVSKSQADQSIIYRSYFGGTDEENAAVNGLDARPDKWLSGFNTLSTDMPITENTFQNSFAGVFDGFISIFSLSGTLDYSTYIGGSDYDAIVSTKFYHGENGFVIGGATESVDFPTTDSAYIEEYQGNIDIFLSSFNENGQLSWSTYFGGLEQDDINDLAVDANG